MTLEQLKQRAEALVAVLRGGDRFAPTTPAHLADLTPASRENLQECWNSVELACAALLSQVYDTLDGVPPGDPVV